MLPDQKLSQIIGEVIDSMGGSIRSVKVERLQAWRSVAIALEEAGTKKMQPDLPRESEKYAAMNDPVMYNIVTAIAQCLLDYGDEKVRSAYRVAGLIAQHERAKRTREREQEQDASISQETDHGTS